jgi:hypothetical protein
MKAKYLLLFGRKLPDRLAQLPGLEVLDRHLVSRRLRDIAAVDNRVDYGAVSMAGLPPQLIDSPTKGGSHDEAISIAYDLALIQLTEVFDEPFLQRILDAALDEGVGQVEGFELAPEGALNFSERISLQWSIKLAAAHCLVP